MGNDYESVIQELLELSDVIPLYQRCGGDYWNAAYMYTAHTYSFE